MERMLTGVVMLLLAATGVGATQLGSQSFYNPDFSDNKTSVMEREFAQARERHLALSPLHFFRRAREKTMDFLTGSAGQDNDDVYAAAGDKQVGRLQAAASHAAAKRSALPNLGSQYSGRLAAPGAGVQADASARTAEVVSSPTKTVLPDVTSTR